MKNKIEFKKPVKLSFGKSGTTTDESIKVAPSAFTGAPIVTVVDVGVGEIKKKAAFITPGAPIGQPKETTGNEVWYPGKRELTDKEEALREKDMGERFGVKGENGQRKEHSMVVGDKKGEEFKELRRTNWIPPSEVEKMPSWKPVLQPVVDQVIEESVKEVADWMGTTARAEKEKVVGKLAGKVLKKLPGHDRELVEKRIWGTLFDLMRDQGVSNKS